MTDKEFKQKIWDSHAYAVNADDLARRIKDVLDEDRKANGDTYISSKDPFEENLWVDDNPIWYDVDALEKEIHTSGSLKAQLHDVKVTFKVVKNESTDSKLYELENYGDEACFVWTKPSKQQMPIWSVLKGNDTVTIGDNFDVKFIRVEKSK